MSSRFALFAQLSNKIGGGLSCAGSAYIIQDILRHPERRQKSIYHRTMLGLSSADILYSLFTFILGSWPMPTGSYQWALGNLTTCDTAAFLGLMGTIGSMMYNCSLATFYLFQLKYGWSDRRMKSIEKWLHIVPFLVALVFCSVTHATKMLGPGIGHCWVALPYPVGCDAADSGVKCIRGVLNRRWYYLGVYLLNLLCIIYVSITMFAVYKAVSDIETNANRYSFISVHRKQDRKKSRKRSRRVMIQGILYSATMILLWLLIAIRITYFLITKLDNIVLHFSTIMISPLQGLFNVCIYLIPVFRKKLKARRQSSIMYDEEDLRSSRNHTPLTMKQLFKNKSNMEIGAAGGIMEPREISVMDAFHPVSDIEEDEGEISVPQYAFHTDSQQEEENREMSVLHASYPAGSNIEEKKNEIPMQHAFHTDSNIEEENREISAQHAFHTDSNIEEENREISAQHAFHIDSNIEEEKNEIPIQDAFRTDSNKEEEKGVGDKSKISSSNDGDEDKN